MERILFKKIYIYSVPWNVSNIEDLIFKINNEPVKFDASV